MSWPMTAFQEKLSILVVDDDSATADLLVELLSDEAGYRAWCVTSAIQALATLRTHPIDLLVIDVMMPEISGEALYDLLQEDPSTRGTPVVFITAGRGGAQLASRTGRLVLEKPFDLDTFLSSVRSALEGPPQGYGPGLSGLAAP